MKMKILSTSLCVIALAGVVALDACSRQSDPDADVLGAAMHTYLEKRGDLCLAKNSWPIDVTQHEIDSGGRNALQMPAFERLGLVTSTVAEIDVDDEGVKHHMKVRRYELTDAGRKFYLTRKFVPSTGANAGKQIETSDLCAAHLSLDRIVKWDMQQDGAKRQAVVTYTYHVDAAPWTQDAEIQKVFPMVAGVIHGAGKAELKETFALSDNGWIAIDLLGS